VSPVPAPKTAQPSPEADAAARASAMEQAKAMRQQVEQALAEMNQRMQQNGRTLAFSMDERSDRMVIKVSNTATGEVVRQIPDEVVLRIARSLEEFKGLLHDEST